MLPEIVIRFASPSDLSAIAEIYSQAIAHGGCTADTISPGEGYWQVFLDEHPADSFPLLVAVNKDRVVGWLSISPYRKGRHGLRFTAELSYYVHDSFQRRGVCTDLLGEAIRLAPKLGLKTYIAILLDENTRSIGLLERFGFTRWAQLPGVADFDGQEMGQYYYGLRVG